MNKKRILAAAVALCFAVTGTIGTSASVFAAGCWSAPTESMDIDSTTITAAGHRAAQTLVEILGLNNKACQNMAGNKDGIVDGDADQLDPAYNTTDNGGMYDTQQEAGDNCKILGVFGSDLNSSPDPYYYNYYYNLYANTTGKAEPVSMDNAILCINGKLSPNEADVKDEDAYGGVSASVYSRADILIGTGSNNKGRSGAEKTGMTYAQYFAELNTETSEYANYNPIIFKYAYTDVYQEGESLQNLAKTMNSIGEKNGSIRTDEINTHQGTTGRYGDPLVTANDYQLYVKGLSAYVSMKMKEQGIAKKKVVVIDPATSTAGQTGDSEMPGTGWFKAYDNTTKDGLAKKTRGAECLENVTENLLTTYKADSSKVYKYTDSHTNTAYAITEDVVEEADVIVIQGAQSDIDVFSQAQFENYMKKQYGWTDKQLAKKVIISENPQCVYGLTCNSSETALGYGFYMGYVYPEILDPVDAVAYFYKKCLHITSEKALQKFMNTNVAAAVANMDDPSTDLSDNWEATITSDIKQGVAYFNSLSAEDQAEFYFVAGKRICTDSGVQSGIFTEEYDEEHVNSILNDTTDLSGMTVTLDQTAYTYDGKAKTPAVTVAGLTEEKDYTVAYSNNTNAGTATVTVTGAGTWTGTATATFKIAKASQKVTVSNISKTYKRSTVKKSAKSFTLKGTAKGKVTYAKKTGSSKLKVTSAGKVTVKKGTKKGTYKAVVTVKAAATANYNAATTTKTVKVRVK